MKLKLSSQTIACAILCISLFSCKGKNTQGMGGFARENLYKYRLSFLKIQLIVGFSLFFSFYFHYFSLYNTQYVYLCHADEKDGKSLATRCFTVFFI